MTANKEEQPRSARTIIGGSRLKEWFALGFCTSIALIALVTRFGTFDNQRAIVKWALSVLCISLGLACLAVIANVLVPDKFTGTQVEGGMVRKRCPDEEICHVGSCASTHNPRTCWWHILVPLVSCSTGFFVGWSSVHYECRKSFSRESKWKHS